MTDAMWMAQALALAALGEGFTPPNPMVGCLVVRDGTVVGSGRHRVAGEPHAEREALAAAGGHAHGATLYVNLEPCSHQGRTPPCVAAIVGSGVARVVAAVATPAVLRNLRRCMMSLPGSFYVLSIIFHSAESTCHGQLPLAKAGKEKPRGAGLFRRTMVWF